jgi:hypothetical protein
LLRLASSDEEAASRKAPQSNEKAPAGILAPNLNVGKKTI